MRKFIYALLLTAAITGVSVGNIHAAEDDTKTQEPVKKHTVAQGESLSTIATENQLETWRPLWNANTDLQNPDQINPGQELVIPTAATTDRPLPAGYGEPVAAPVSAAPAYTSYRSAPAARVNHGAPGGDVLSRIRSRESGGNYGTNTGNGYYGAYQYDVGTWNNYGGYRYASDAPPAVQDAKAAETYAARGCSPWPSTCY